MCCQQGHGWNPVQNVCDWFWKSVRRRINCTDFARYLWRRHLHAPYWSCPQFFCIWVRELRYTQVRWFSLCYVNFLCKVRDPNVNSVRILAWGQKKKSCWDPVFLVKCCCLCMCSQSLKGVWAPGIMACKLFQWPSSMVCWTKKNCTPFVWDDIQKVHVAHWATQSLCHTLWKSPRP